jgi:thiamine-phosphate pyrophosphorylase
LASNINFKTMPNTLTPAETEALAHQIATTHAHLLAGEALNYAQASLSTDGDEAHPFAPRAALLRGCRMLGFLEHDAQCVVNAWEKQTHRMARFDLSLWPTMPEDFEISTQRNAQAFPPCPHALGLYAVLPDAQWVARMARAGVPTVQLRFKSNDARAIEQEVQAAVAAVQGTTARLFINDHWQAAIQSGAYGVHLGQEDMSDAPLAHIREAGLRLGLSTHGYAEMLRAQAVQPSYIALGAVFPTTLKRMTTAPQGLGRLHAYARLIQHYPLVAIGGIDAALMPAVLRSGVGSIAMVRAITQALDPEATVHAFQKILDTASKYAKTCI